MADTTDSRTLRSGFLESSRRFPDRPALEVDGARWSYRRLHESAASIAATLIRDGAADAPPLTAVLAHRSASAFAGILGALLRGHAYVPMNPNFPAERTATMLRRSSARELIVGEEAIPALAALLPAIEAPLTVVLPATADAALLRERFPAHRFVDAAALAPAAAWAPGAVDPAGTAYLLFTSGSTGVPKGVQVAHRNITHFVDAMVRRYEIDEHDRFSQMFELVFDLSLFDMFVAWERGACVCCPNKGDAVMPARYIVDSKITVWF